MTDLYYIILPEGYAELEVVNKALEIIENEDPEKILPNFRPETPFGAHGIIKNMCGLCAPVLPNKDVRALIVRDIEIGESKESLIQSVNDSVKRMFENRNFNKESLSKYELSDNVIVWCSEKPRFRIALHLANIKWKSCFINSTIDDYILYLALDTTVIKGIKSFEDTVCNMFVRLIKDEVPEVLRKYKDDGLSFDTAKQYLRMYSAILKDNESTRWFTKKILKCVNESAFKSRFKDLLLALEHLAKS